CNPSINHASFCYCSLSLSCSFSRHAHHRDLHSFPTRRSSDLVLAGVGQQVDEDLVEALGVGVHPHPGRAVDLDVEVGDLHRLGRSEEHTSELQSRENLVCRLLLAKKKKTINK